MTKAQSRRRGREDILLEVRRIILRGEHSPLLKGKEGLKKRKSPDLTLTRQGINGDGKRNLFSVGRRRQKLATGGWERSRPWGTGGAGARSEPKSPRRRQGRQRM